MWRRLNSFMQDAECALLLAYTAENDTKEMFEYLDNWQEETMKTKATELKTLCDLNLAAVALKVDDFVETRYRCKKVLEKERTNVKALYRLAQAAVA